MNDDNQDIISVKNANGDLFWIQNHQYHREDGAAIVRAGGTMEYWYRGVRIKISKHKNSNYCKTYRQFVAALKA